MIDSTDRNLVYDVEANGLLLEATKIWCIYAIDKDTQDGFLFHDHPEFDGVTDLDDEGNEFTLPSRSGSLRDGARFLSRAKQLICHNQLGYDLFLLQRFFPQFRIRYDYPAVRDTYLESEVQDFKRPNVKGYKGVHGLAVWGARVGVRKPDIQDWSYIDAKKLNRCIEDVKINLMVADALEAERNKIADKCDGIDFTRSLEVEHEYRYWITKHQEIGGCKVDKEHMERCVKELDQILAELKKDIEPNLPPVWKAVGSSKVTYDEIKGLLGMKRGFTEMRVSWIPPEKEQIVVFNRSPKHYMDSPDITKKVPNRVFANPTLRYLNSKKQPTYTVVNDLDNTEQGPFMKLREARDWVKENLPDVPKKSIAYRKGETVLTTVNDFYCEWFGITPQDTGYIGGPFTRVTSKESTMNQGEVVKKYLLSLGWEPTEWTVKKDSKGTVILNTNTWLPVKGSPKLTEDSYDSLPEGIGQSIAKYNTLKHRRSYIKNDTDDSKGVLNHIREDGRVSCGLNTFGTVSGRASHYNIVNLPSVSAVYGENMRKILVAEEGYELCGVDMSNAHARILSFHTQNQTFLDAVLSGKEEELDGTFVGTDFHSVNCILFGLATEEERDHAASTQCPKAIKKFKGARKNGKPLSFMCLYGGSAAKLAAELDITIEDAKARINSFFVGLGLDLLLDDLNEMWKNQSYRTGAFITVYGDYHVYCNSKHKLINTMAIGSEAALQKYSIIWACREIDKQNLDVTLVASFHDEALFEVNTLDKKEFTPIAEQFYEEGASQMAIHNDFVSVALWGTDYSNCH